VIKIPNFSLYPRYKIMSWDIPNRTGAWNPLLLSRALSGIPKSKSSREFQSLCKIPSFTATVEFLNFLLRNGIGKRSKTNLVFSDVDKLKLILFLLQNGCDRKYLSSMLDWRDFESFTRIILEQADYFCQTNVHLRKPRFQIDIVGRDGKRALFVDCKHWKDMSKTKRTECAYQQEKRARAYMKIDRNIKIGIPIIVTLNEPVSRFVGRVPFIAINRLQMFLKDYDLFQSEICCISNM